MTIQAACPHCGKGLSAAANLAGKMIACPSCERMFPLSPPTGGATETGRSDFPPPAIRYDAPPRRTTTTRGIATPAAPQPPTPSARRPGKTAEFIAADPSVMAIPLNEDGQLPKLVLSEGEKKPDKEESVRSASPLLLGAALVISFLISAAMLVIEAPMGGHAPGLAEKDVARRDLEEFYTGGGELILQRHQQLLREAIQAHHRGDEQTEKQRYRQVMDMLKAEGHNPFSGLTGRRNDELPPSDRHLEETLSTLLGD